MGPSGDASEGAALEGGDADLWGPGGLAQRVFSHLNVPSRSWPGLLCQTDHHLGPVLDILRTAGPGSRQNLAAAAEAEAAEERRDEGASARSRGDDNDAGDAEASASSAASAPPLPAAPPRLAIPPRPPQPPPPPQPGSCASASFSSSAVLLSPPGTTGHEPTAEDSSPGQSADIADILRHHFSRAASADEAAAAADTQSPAAPTADASITADDARQSRAASGAEAGASAAAAAEGSDSPQQLEQQQQAQSLPVYPKAVLAIWELLRASVGGLAGDVDGRSVWRALPTTCPP